MKLHMAACTALLLLTTSTHAAVPVCEDEFKSFWQDLATTGTSQLSGLALADISRQTIRGYNACVAADGNFNARGFLERLARAFNFQRP